MFKLLNYLLTTIPWCVHSPADLLVLTTKRHHSADRAKHFLCYRPGLGVRLQLLGRHVSCQLKETFSFDLFSNSFLLYSLYIFDKLKTHYWFPALNNQLNDTEKWYSIRIYMCCTTINTSHVVYASKRLK